MTSESSKGGVQRTVEGLDTASVPSAAAMSTSTAEASSEPRDVLERTPRAAKRPRVGETARVRAEAPQATEGPRPSRCDFTGGGASSAAPAGDPSPSSAAGAGAGASGRAARASVTTPRSLYVCADPFPERGDACACAGICDRGCGDASPSVRSGSSGSGSGTAAASRAVGGGSSRGVDGPGPGPGAKRPRVLPPCLDLFAVDGACACAGACDRTHGGRIQGGGDDGRGGDARAPSLDDAAVGVDLKAHADTGCTGRDDMFRVGGVCSRPKPCSRNPAVE